MSNHEPIIPTINDQTTTIPAAPDHQYPPNMPAITQVGDRIEVDDYNVKNCDDYPLP